MKSLVSVAVAVAVLASPIMSFAETNGPVTRAEVRAQLVQLEKAGYTVGAEDPTYPADIQAAEAKVGSSQATSTVVDAVGGVRESGSSRSSAPRHSAKSSCGGPVSFCSTYFGH